MAGFLRELRSRHTNRNDKSFEGIIYPNDAYQYGVKAYSLLSGERAEDVDGAENDLHSTYSVSTNSTMDNNVGTGRTIDNWIYQPGGRLLERVAARIIPAKKRGKRYRDSGCLHYICLTSFLTLS